MCTFVACHINTRFMSTHQRVTLPVLNLAACLQLVVPPNSNEPQPMCSSCGCCEWKTTVQWYILSTDHSVMRLCLCVADWTCCQADTVVASVSHPETICLNYGRGVAPLFPQQASLDSEKSGIEVAWFGSGPMSSF